MAFERKMTIVELFATTIMKLAENGEKNGLI